MFKKKNMAEEVKNVTGTPVVENEEVKVETPQTEETGVTDEQIETTMKRVRELHTLREDLNKLNNELTVRDSDLAEAETVFGTKSKEYETKKNLLDHTLNKIEETKKKIEELSYKRSELKPVLDALTEKFSDAYKETTSKEYHITLATKSDSDEPDPAKSRKVFKKLLDYLNHDVTFTPKTVSQLMLLVRDMDKNKPWVNSPDFTGTIILHAAEILSLQTFIVNELTGKGFFEAREFLDCWSYCGKVVSETIREIQKDNVRTRQVGADLNDLDHEFEISENDIPEDEAQVTTKEEVAPDVTE